MAKFNIRNSAEALKPLPDIPFIVTDLVDEASLVILAGDAGTGKTYLVLEMAVCVATGRSFLGIFPTQKAKVLFIDEESGEKRLLRRIKKIFNAKGITTPIDLDFVTLSGLDLFTKQKRSDYSELDTTVSNNGYKLIVIDALMDIVPGADENSVKDIKPALQALRNLAEKNNCAIVLLHHTNKKGGFRGTTAIKGTPDSLYIVTKTGNTINIKSEKNRDSEPLNINAKIDFVEEAVFLTSTTPLTFGKVETEVIKFLANNGQSTTSEIDNGLKKIKISKGSIGNCLPNLCKKSICEKINPHAGQGVEGIYKLRDEGMEYAIDKNWVNDPFIMAFYPKYHPIPPDIRVDDELPLP